MSLFISISNKCIIFAFLGTNNVADYTLYGT